MSYPQFGYSYPAAASSLASTQLLMNATAAAGSAGVSSVTSAGTSCCENGRPIMTDPHTGQTVCSCQYSPSLLTYPRVTGLSDSVYNSATAAYAAQGYMNAFGTPDPSAFYSPLNYDLAKESGETWRSLPQPTACYPYDPTMSAYPYGASYGMDLNGAARRKNATRETTSTLKAWLYEHRKNPYPTKGEKIMLAIITKMTLTQVSTWFANARRRLKKENKMTWSPRNRCGEDKDDLDSDGDDDDDKDNSNHSNQDREEDEGNKSDILVSDGEQEKDGTTNQEMLNKSSSTLSPSQEGTVQGNINGERPSNQPSMNCSFSSQSNATQSSQNTNKPRIWSIAQVATSSDNHSSNIVGDRSSSPGLSQSVNFSQHALSVPGQTLSATPTRTLHWGIGGAYTVAGMTRPGVTHPYYSPGRGLTSSHQATAVLSNNQVETPPNTPPSLAKKYPTGGFLNTPALPYSAFSAKIPNGSGINNHEVKTEAFLHSDATKTAFKPVTKSKFNDLVKA